MAKQYRLYECPYDSLPEKPRAVYSHYENGRMLILYSCRKANKEWKLLTPEEIRNLSPHEKRWYLQSKNEINAAYLKTPEAQERSIEYVQKLLEIYERNLKQLQKEVENAEKENNCNGDTK